MTLLEIFGFIVLPALAIIVAIFFGIRQYRLSKQQLDQQLKISQEQKQEPQTNKEKVIISDISANQILNDIRLLPLYQQKDAGKAYKGLEIIWSLVLSRIDPKIPKDKNAPNIYEIYAIDLDSKAVTFEIDIEKYPFLKIAKHGDKLYVKGTITYVGGFYINIKVKELSNHPL